ncbi:3-dehydroquinate synthase [Saccharospirillum salsuginis]|uniref:3-dehydroquinate synthase n=1 Tax=Saccharospirillum salsuginis TaxID=418750 RepID=A0A918N7S8_9GAMM|nr:3-dehydroquinate synthase [Saccharospirillum salsuginis]
MLLTVELGERSYPILIEPGCMNRKDQWSERVPHAEVVIVTNETIAPLYLDSLKRSLERSGRRLLSLTLPDGESYKSAETLGRIYDFLLEHSISRKAVLIALGGGVIGDLTGYAAATFQRGIDFIQVPTTLLSQVDSSVGGKTGINHPLGKNMIGAFKQPKSVVIDPAVLSTLPDRELSAGLAEVIKYGLIHDADFFEWLETNIDALLAKDADALVQAIARSCRLKADIVAADETEQGIRAILNLGHTFGHAIEAELGYGLWLHGEAVAAGMVMASDLSQRQGWIDGEVTERARNLLSAARLPVAPPPQMTPDRFMNHMARDKKVESGQLRLVLLEALGRATVTSTFDPARLEACLSAFCTSHSQP